MRSPQRAGEFRAHCQTLAGATLAASVGTVGLQAYTGGAFAAAIVKSGLFSRTQLSVATLLLSVTVALVSPLTGYLLDRYGARRVIGLALLGEAAAFASLGIVPTGFAGYCALMIALAILGAGSTPPGVARIVTARFDEHRGLALGILISGLGVMAITAPVWAQAAIAHVGWRGGYLVVAGVVLAIGGGGWLLMGSEAIQPRPSSALAAGNWSALREPRFWLLIAGFTAPALFGGGYLFHLISLLQERGFSPRAAALLQSFIGIAVLFGRLGSGAALDRFPANRVAALTFTVSAIGCLLLLSSLTPLIALAIVGIGLTIGAELDIMAFIISKMFPVESFGRLYSLAYGLLIAAGGSSPFLISKLADQGGFGLALPVSAAGMMIGVVLLATSRVGAPKST